MVNKIIKIAVYKISLHMNMSSFYILTFLMRYLSLNFFIEGAVLWF